MSSTTHLLTLPYDVRHHIYEHLFPPFEQIYIEALDNDLRSITPEHKIPTNLLQTCRALNAEASEYLYNRFLFNIIGKKKETLASYPPFVDTVRRYARHDVHVDAFSNGVHSATMCLSIQAGEGKMAFMKSRERGEPKRIQELEEEIALNKGNGAQSSNFGLPSSSILSINRQLAIIAMAFGAVIALLLAWVLRL